MDVAIKHAHLAIDQAKRSRMSFAAFDPEQYGDPAASLSLMSEMRQATERGDMRIFYQPKLNVRKGRFESVEALCRWFHPERGYISPDQFIPQAEETGHIRALTEWVLMTAMEDQRRLVSQGLPVSVAVNISGAVISDRGFARKARGMIVGAAGPVTLEITESQSKTSLSGARQEPGSRSMITVPVSHPSPTCKTFHLTNSSWTGNSCRIWTRPPVAACSSSRLLIWLIIWVWSWLQRASKPRLNWRCSNCLAATGFRASFCPSHSRPTHWPSF